MTIKNAMVLAAGLGTRMRPITDTIPKPLVKIAGKPMIDYALDSLVEAGAETIVVNVHHHAEQMIAHLENRTDAEILISDEQSQLMNSGGGLAKGLKLASSACTMALSASTADPATAPSSRAAFLPAHGRIPSPQNERRHLADHHSP